MSYNTAIHFAITYPDKVYGARLGRNTLAYVQAEPSLAVDRTYFLKQDTYLVIEGTRR